MRIHFKYAAAVLLTVSVTPMVVFASETGQGQSIMFEQPKSHLTHMPEANDSRAEECEALSREIEALKGKPQRRYAASQRYDAQCKDFRR